MTGYRPGILSIMLVLLLIFLQYRLWFESGGIADMMRLKKKLAVEAQQNEQLKKRNQALLQQVQYLQKNNDAVESRARRELGMVKKGETFYQVIDK
jgi:cell division protein FtsB